MIAPTPLRIAAAAFVIAWLAWETWDRAINDDMADPSISVGRDYFLFRASGLVAIALGVLVAAVLLGPEIIRQEGGLAIGLLLVGILGYWTYSEAEEYD